jgi:hypothetical protein
MTFAELAAEPGEELNEQDETEYRKALNTIDY